MILPVPPVKVIISWDACVFAFGCTVPWSSYDHAFICPCHASSFDITGDVLSPPAPRALDLHPVRIENGIVKVDTGTRLKRSSFDESQVTYA